MRQSWTDDRLDDLSHRMDQGFDRVAGEIKDLRAEMKDLRAEMKEDSRALQGDLRALQRTMIQVGWALVTAFASGIAAAIVGMVVTQL